MPRSRVVFAPFGVVVLCSSLASNRVDIQYNSLSDMDFVVGTVPNREGEFSLRQYGLRGAASSGLVCSGGDFRSSSTRSSFVRIARVFSAGKRSAILCRISLRV